MTQPISVITSLAYAGVGVAIHELYPAPEATVAAAALCLLAVGTALYHGLPGVRWARSLDHAGMNAVFAALATYAAGGPWYLMLLAGAAAAYVLEYQMNVHNYPIMGAFVWIIFTALFAAESYNLLSASIASFGFGFYLWLGDTDSLHGAWHILTAAGIGFAWMGLA